ncbi:MAG: hypothetical protein AAF985_01290 [Bacteroidota bacterium]
MVRSLFCGFLIAFLLLSCSDQQEMLPIDLQAYIDANAQLPPHDELIACAAGGQVGILDDAPVSMILKPHYWGITDLRYYESTSSDIDPNDLSQFVEKELGDEALFNGFLRRFKLPIPESDRWARVSFVANDTLWYCKAVRLKFYEQASVFNNTDWCTVDLNTPTEPSFVWEEGTTQNNIIFFQVISDQNGQAISGTYTTERSFQFYDLANVVLNVTDPGPIPVLLPNENYQFTLMGVSSDNWVNLIIQKDFTTE